VRAAFAALTREQKCDCSTTLVLDLARDALAERVGLVGVRSVAILERRRSACCSARQSLAALTVACTCLAAAVFAFERRTCRRRSFGSCRCRTGPQRPPGPRRAQNGTQPRRSSGSGVLLGAGRDALAVGVRLVRVRAVACLNKSAPICWRSVAHCLAALVRSPAEGFIASA
jgi:hypothetical protein